MNSLPLNTLPQPMSRDTFTLHQDRFRHYAEHRLMALLSERISMERMREYFAQCDDLSPAEHCNVLMHFAAIAVVKPKVLNVSEEEGMRNCFGANVRRAHSLLFSVLYSGFYYGELAAYHGIPGHGRTIARRHASIRRRIEMIPMKPIRGESRAFVEACITKEALTRAAVALARLEVKYGREYADTAEADTRRRCKGYGPRTAESNEWNHEGLLMEAERYKRGHRVDTARQTQDTPADEQSVYALAA